MNKVCLVGCPNFSSFVEELVDGFKNGGYYISHTLTRITFHNKYFQAFLEFCDYFQENGEYSAIIYFGKPEVFLSNTESLETAIVIDETAELGQYDTGDLLFEYVLSVDELAELLAQTAWENVITAQKTIVHHEDENSASPGMDINEKIEALIEAINDADIRCEVKHLEHYIESQSDDVESFENAFSLIEQLEQTLLSVNDDDRKLAATAVALLLEEGLGTD